VVEARRGERGAGGREDEGVRATADDLVEI